ncbi:hypothetical protein GALL_96060 [mine drainage metagenome]|uniref:Sialate O-acetylesterase domain-containing protein n=1 Tax=mine drainage metagenome TaxID=410659 RepID=A0A1J5SJJ0_9ZZZZ
MKLRLLTPALAALGLLLTPHLNAAVRCPAVFSDHMVLQSRMPLPVWGEASPGESVTVAFAGEHATTVTGPDGRWSVKLAALPPSAEPRTLTVSDADSRLTFSDVLVGEVWFCSGQSNMEKPLGPRKGQKPTNNYQEELTHADCPLVRIYQMPHSGKWKPHSTLMRWQPCNASTLMETGFSAAAYYFSRELQRVLNEPVGVIDSSYGGTRIETWMSQEAFASDPRLAPLAHIHLGIMAAKMQPSELYQRMVVPFIPFAVRGFLWYQGESNCMNAEGSIYTAKMRALIDSWRASWGEPEAPFYYALIAPFTYSHEKHWDKLLSPDALPALWEAQIAALSIPHTGLITLTDIAGTMKDIHPTDKRDVGLRFARLALAETYHVAGIHPFAPRIVSTRPSSDGASLVLTLEHARGLHSRDNAPLDEFTVAGKDGQFHAADARIDGERIVVSSPAVPHPVAVRFAWLEKANPNLVNDAGLPALPYRSDTWPLTLELPRSR